MEAPSVSQWVNLALPRLGARIVSVSDEFFAPAERMLSPAPPVFFPDRYDDHGKWMDGWESRRRRGPGHDACVVRLGVRGIIHAVDIDTHYFTGNFPPCASLEAARTESEPDENTPWETLVPRMPLSGDAGHRFTVQDTRAWTHVRLNIFPDGGVARLRVYGEAEFDWQATVPGARIDLSLIHHGGRAMACSDEHYGSMQNLIMPGRGLNMGDGWETRRRRGPGHDWAILRLGHPGVVSMVEVDTAHFKGNYPDRVSIQAVRLDDDVPVEKLVHDSIHWPVLMPEQKLRMDHRHLFDDALAECGAVSHARINIYPDGGLSRVRMLGCAAN